MDTLAAFDNAVEKLLEVSPFDPLPEQLAKLRFLFEAEFEKDGPEDLLSVELTVQDRWR